MSELITFELDGQKVTATPDQSIWDVAKGQGTTIPYLCHADRGPVWWKSKVSVSSRQAAFASRQTV